MYRLIRVDKRTPSGSLGQSRRAYLLPDVHGWTRVYEPVGTRWSNRLGGWTQEHEGISLFRTDRGFTISCHGAPDAKSFYVDMAHRIKINRNRIEFVDLFLDVMLYSPRRVVEKDEDQLGALPAELQRSARDARDHIRRLIAENDPLFDARSDYYALPGDASELPPNHDTLAL